ncbi:MAG: transglycosylase domain-containing protein [Bacteroidota bacterium]
MNPTLRKRIIKIYWLLVIVPIVSLLLMIFIISQGWFGYMPDFKELENPKSNLSSEIYSADGVLLGKYFIQNRSNVHYSDLSPNLVNALIATEDVRFNKHSGIDFKSFIRVFVGVLTGNRGAGGGSTITQQLAKNLFPREDDPGMFRMGVIKLKEWITAVKLEYNYTKEEIIAMYLNTVEFGNQSFGIKSAAKTYFNKTPDSLNVEESALLIGMLKAPTFYSPIKNPKNAMMRRTTVLTQMYKYKYLTKQQFDSICALPIDMSHFKLQDHKEGLAPYFREYLRQELEKWCLLNKKPDGTNYNLYKDGLKIYTTIDSRMQRYAEEAVNEHMKMLQGLFFKHWKGMKNAPFDWTMNSKGIAEVYEQGKRRSDRYISMKKAGASDELIDKAFNTPIPMSVFTWKGDRDTVMSPMDSIKYYKFYLQAGFMAVEPQTGFVKAYVGGINYRHFMFDHVVVGKRQVGSTFKPFLYTLAMQEGEFTPCSKVPNIPVSFDLGDDKPPWTPRNSSDAREGEMVTLKWALANSVNYISAFLMKRYKPEAVIQIVRKMGITTPIAPVPSICLGSCDLSLYEMVGAFATYANKGRYIQPIFVTRIEDKNGNILADFRPKSTEAFSEETACLMLELMKGVILNGTGARLHYTYNLKYPIAGKTGTTQNNSDGWFIGITPQLAAGAWVGAEDRSVHFRSTDYGQGAAMALPIWAIFMKKVYADKKLNISKGDFGGMDKIKDRLNCTGNEEVVPEPDDMFDHGIR